MERAAGDDEPPFFSFVDSRNGIGLREVRADDRKDLRAVRTTDGGETWTHALVPNLSWIDENGPFERASDPVAGFDSSGELYFNSLGVNVPNGAPPTGDLPWPLVFSQVVQRSNIGRSGWHQCT